MAKFFEQLGGAPAVVAFTNGDWMDYVEEHFEEAGRGRERKGWRLRPIRLRKPQRRSLKWSSNSFVFQVGFK